MKLGFVYDTESTGIPDWHNPSGGEDQPHIVQLVAKQLIDLETREEINMMNQIVKPDGWIIPDEAAEIHGITTEMAAEKGEDEEVVVLEFFSMWTTACAMDPKVLRIGHSEVFDRRIIRIATKRIPGLSEFEEPWHSLPKDRSYCTMYKSTKAVGIPPTNKMRASGRYFNKNPTLTEAYEHFTGKPMEGAHNALADVDACIEVYFGIQAINDHEEEAVDNSGFGKVSRGVNHE